jgi:hypothetical protein
MTPSALAVASKLNRAIEILPPLRAPSEAMYPMTT